MASGLIRNFLQSPSRRVSILFICESVGCAALPSAIMHIRMVWLVPYHVGPGIRGHCLFHFSVACICPSSPPLPLHKQKWKLTSSGLASLLRAASFSILPDVVPL